MLNHGSKANVARDLDGMPEDDVTAANSTRGRGKSPSPIRSKHNDASAHTPGPAGYRQPPQPTLPLTHQTPPTMVHDATGGTAPKSQGPESVVKVDVPDSREAPAPATSTSSAGLLNPHFKRLSLATETAAREETERKARRRESLASTAPRRDSDSTAHDPKGGTSHPPHGKVQVRVTRDGKMTLEELEPNELAHLYAQQQAALQKMQRQFNFLTVPDWVRLHPMLGPYVAEFTGSFAWVLTLSLTSIRNESIFNKADDTNVTCLPIGFMFTSMVFTFGYISGGHFNPAISLAVFFIRRMDLVRCLTYIICQLAAAFCAGVVAMLIQGSTDIFVPSVGNSFVSSGIFSELIYTFAVALVVLNIGYSRQSGNFFYGFAIGMTMAAGSASVGRISGGAFNPAAATGLQLALCMAGSCDDLKSFWIYWLAPIIGAIVASLLYSQMYQPMTTQVLQDHKVLRDPAKRLMSARSAHDETGSETTTRAEGDTDRESESEDSRDNGELESTQAADPRRRNRKLVGNRGEEDDEQEMSDKEVNTQQSWHGRNQWPSVLNDSLTEPVVVRRSGEKRAGDLDTLV